MWVHDKPIEDGFRLIHMELPDHTHSFQSTCTVLIHKIDVIKDIHKIILKLH